MITNTGKLEKYYLQTLAKTEDNLGFICTIGNIQMIEKAIKLGFPMSSKVLYWACINKKVDIVKVLVDNKCPMEILFIDRVCFNNPDNLEVIEILAKVCKIDNIIIGWAYQKGYKDLLKILVKNFDEEIDKEILDHARINLEMLNILTKK